MKSAREVQGCLYPGRLDAAELPIDAHRKSLCSSESGISAPWGSPTPASPTAGAVRLSQQQHGLLDGAHDCRVHAEPEAVVEGHGVIVPEDRGQAPTTSVSPTLRQGSMAMWRSASVAR